MFTDQNLTLMTDLYQLTMMQGYYHYGKKDRTVVFDLFYRDNPFSAAFSIVAAELRRTHAQKLHTSLQTSLSDSVQIKPPPIVGLRGVKAQLSNFIEGRNEIHLMKETGDWHAKSHTVRLLTLYFQIDTRHHTVL